MLGFGKKTGDKYPLEIKCKSDCFEKLKDYITKRTYNPDEIVIYITRTNTGEHSTTGTLVTDDGTISGYTVELPRGTDDECKTSCDDTSIPYDCYCIMEGTYDFEVNTKVYEEENKQYLTNNSLRIISDIENGRDGVLVHKGSDDAKGWAKGCILPMPSRPIDNCKYGDYKVPPRIDSNVSHQFVIDICNWVRQRENEIRQRNAKVKNIPHRIVISKTF